MGKVALDEARSDSEVEMGSKEERHQPWTPDKRCCLGDKGIKLTHLQRMKRLPGVDGKTESVAVCYRLVARARTARVSEVLRSIEKSAAIAWQAGPALMQRAPSRQASIASEQARASPGSITSP